MVDVVRANLVKAMFYWQGPSGLPTDRFVITSWWQDMVGQTMQEAAEAIAEAYVDFYTQFKSMTPEELGTAKLRVYDHSIPKPRVPYGPETTVLPTAVGTAAKYPREVAITCSYHNGGPGPRNKGRFYVGPLNSICAEEVTADGRVAPSALIRGHLCDAMQRWVDTPPTGWQWMQVSPTNMDAYPVAGGWVDDAFDTQRSRGAEPTTRTTWGAEIVNGVGGTPGGPNAPV